MRRVYGDRCQNGENLLHEIMIKPFFIIAIQFFRINHTDFFFFQQTGYFTPSFLLRLAEARHRFANFLQLLFWREPILTGCFNAGAHLASDAGHTHHVELFKV